MIKLLSKGLRKDISSQECDPDKHCSNADEKEKLTTRNERLKQIQRGKKRSELVNRVSEMVQEG